MTTGTPKKKRHAITDTPFGSPFAGPVRVAEYDEEGNLLGMHEEDAWDSDLLPGETLNKGMTRATDPRSYETGESHDV